MRSGTTRLLILASLFATAAVGAGNAEPRVDLEIFPREATVGDRLQATLRVWLPPESALETDAIGPHLGPFDVSAGSWSGPVPDETGQRWIWDGSLIPFRTGNLELPPVRIEFLRSDGSASAAESTGLTVVVRSVLRPEELAEGERPELAELKPPASLEPDYSGLWSAGALLALLLTLVAVAWWLHRRYAAKLARVEMPDDPFRRVPPHVWVHDALRKLLDRGLLEQGQLDPFFMELSRIIKVYLGGRYRVDLMERTSGEVPRVLEQARTPGATIEGTRGLLGLADRVKFAGGHPDPESCRRAVESAYEIVETTRPREETEPVGERGAA